RAADMAERGLTYGAGDDGLWVGAAKIVLDRSAGPLHPPRPVLQALVELCADLGFPAAIHAIEADAVAEAAAALALVRDRLPLGVFARIEHASVCPPDVLEQVRRAGVAVVTQPGFLEESGDRYLAQIAAVDLPWLYRLRGFVDAGVPLALSTDCPVIPPDPGRTLRAAVTRRAASGRTLAADEALTARQALWAMTGAGGALGGPSGLGTLRPGSPADVVLLATDPAGEGLPWQVQATLRAGAIVYSA
ncbi:MAG: amidohydrolase family protein, partial [Chloroflexi bacterium]|nr:amidohydrolase family protein [Chloroflexota bacterium]